jgi:hypothetical protein
MRRRLRFAPNRVKHFGYFLMRESTGASHHPDPPPFDRGPRHRMEPNHVFSQILSAADTAQTAPRNRAGVARMRAALLAPPPVIDCHIGFLISFEVSFFRRVYPPANNH